MTHASDITAANALQEVLLEWPANMSLEPRKERGICV